MKKTFYYIDVFTDKKFSGNPAAIFFESDEIKGEIMQKIANELNISETVFLQKSDKADYKARIFTPKKELPFAGHPSIAAFFAFKKFYNISQEKLIQECGAGLIEIEEKDSIISVKQNDPEFAEISADKKFISEIFNIKEGDISDFSPMKISTGIWWGIFHLNNCDAVSRASPNFEKIIQLSKKENIVGVQIFAKTNQEPQIHTRTFAPICGVFEDPTCGSGNGCVASFIAKNNLLSTSNYSATQGKELDREGRVYASFDKTEDKITNIRIGGKAIKVLEGEIEL